MNQADTSPSSTVELEPCPFCGGTADFGTRPNERAWWSLHCARCTVYRVGETEAEAITAWNTRLTECPSCHGLNTSCPNGCGRDPETGELNGTRHTAGLVKFSREEHQPLIEDGFVNHCGLCLFSATYSTGETFHVFCYERDLPDTLRQAPAPADGVERAARALAEVSDAEWAGAPDMKREFYRKTVRKVAAALSSPAPEAVDLLREARELANEAFMASSVDFRKGHPPSRLAGIIARIDTFLSRQTKETGE